MRRCTIYLASNGCIRCTLNTEYYIGSSTALKAIRGCFHRCYLSALFHSVFKYIRVFSTFISTTHITISNILHSVISSACYSCTTQSKGFLYSTWVSVFLCTMVCPRSCSGWSILQLVFYIPSCSTWCQRTFHINSRSCYPCTYLHIRVGRRTYINVNTRIVIYIYHINRYYRTSYCTTSAAHHYIVISCTYNSSRWCITILVSAHSCTSSGTVRCILIPLVAKCAITCSNHL